MDWKTSLDKYLTTPYDDGFDGWCEEIFERQFTDDFYNQNEDWIHEYDGQCNKWLNKLFAKGKTPTEASVIIERAFKIYIPTP